MFYIQLPVQFSKKLFRKIVNNGSHALLLSLVNCENIKIYILGYFVFMFGFTFQRDNTLCQRTS